MTVTMSFNDYDLSEWLDIRDIRRSVGNNRLLLTDDAPYLGVNLQDVRIGAKVIEVDFAIWSRDRNWVKHELARIFHVDEPKRLTFSDEPDKYYLAMPTEGIEMQEGVGRSSEGTVTFLIPDGVAHSSSYRRVEEQMNYVDKSVIDIRNNGSVEAYPIITIKHYEENGWLGLVNRYGAMELGDKAEADAVTVKKSEELFNYHSGNLNDLTTAGVRNLASLREGEQNLTGTFEIVEVWGRPHLKLR